MMNNKRLLAGVALGCVLSAPAAFAEEYRGFYFSAWGGAGSADTASRAEFDATLKNNGAWVQGIFDEIMEDANASPSRPATLTLDELGSDPSSLDDTTDVWGALFGYRVNKWFGAEVGYVNLGEVKYDFSGEYQFVLDRVDPNQPDENDIIPYDVGYRFSSAGPTLAAVGMLPLGQYFELHGKAGIYLADSRQTVRLRNVAIGENIDHTRTDASQTEVFLGVGATWNATEDLALRVEYQRFLDVGDDKKNYEQDIDVISLGVLFK